jgi:hypothetical protein
MRERSKRLTIAVVLTAVDVATFNNYAGVIWRTLAPDPWAQAALLALLGLWVASGVVIWTHVANDLRQTIQQRYAELPLGRAMLPDNLRRDSDV